MIERVYHAAEASAVFDKLIVATDDLRIHEEVMRFGGQVEMTSAHHINGTSRCIEVFEKHGNGFFGMINIQGDEPFVHVAQLQTLAEKIKTGIAPVSTLIRRITNPDLIVNPSIIKVVTALDGTALYFSRSPIPYTREPGENTETWKHIGLYGFKADVISVIRDLKETPAEKAEKLEQLRWLQNGIAIDTAITLHESRSVDTPEDLAWILEHMKAHID